jgi:CRISPR-associated protein Cas5t
LIIDDSTTQAGKWLVQDEKGKITLPYWVDHFGFEKTRWYRYSLIKDLCDFPPVCAWTTIKP